MKIPSDVMWQLTKKYNSNIVKFNGESFSHNPLNLTNLHNRSSSGNLINILSSLGFANDQAIGVQVNV